MAGIQRKGLVLSSLMKFKQICNHPDQYLGQNGYAEPESGKFERLREICETISGKRERVLVFTQFKEITSPLARYLNGVFGHPGLVLHGEVPVKKRKEIVDALDEAETVSKLYRVLGLPTTIFVDRQGIIKRIYFGPMNEKEIEQFVAEILE